MIRGAHPALAACLFLLQAVVSISHALPAAVHLNRKAAVGRQDAGDGQHLGGNDRAPADPVAPYLTRGADSCCSGRGAHLAARTSRSQANASGFLPQVVCASKT